MAEKFMLLDDAERQLLIERYSDLKFEDDTDGFKCVRCNRIPIMHYFTNCGHLLCLNCKRIIDNGGFKCPQCNRLITNASEQRVEFEFQLLSLRSKCPNTKYGCQITTNLAQIPEHVKICEFTQEAALPALLKNKDPTQIMMEKLKLLTEEMEVMRAEVKQLRLKNNEDKFPDATNLQNFVRNETRTGSTKDEIDLEKSQFREMQQIEIEKKNEKSSMRNFDFNEEGTRFQQQSSGKQAKVESQNERQEKIYNKKKSIIDKCIKNFEIQREDTLTQIDNFKKALIDLQKKEGELNEKLKKERSKWKQLDDDYARKYKMEVNLLLVGPTSVGKSTFINAFINYLQFKDLDQAQKSELRCLIPGEFTIYEGGSKAHIFKFGEEDANENTEAQGQSATQKCKVHRREVGNLTLNIIDSPGIGDTRGEDQDMRNVSHIIDFVAPFDDLVIAVLLKPNEARLTAAFENCIRQLLRHFYKTQSEEIIFIFTNSRSFSYQPGDTIIPLKEIFRQLKQASHETPIEIKFGKENVFCMDNEAFRYLVAKKNNIKFNANDYDNFKKSWQTSADECNRMVKYLQGDTSATSHSGLKRGYFWTRLLFFNG